MAEAKNITFIRSWLTANRPNELDGFGAIMTLKSVDPTIEALFSFMMIGFEAGRAFQKENPDSPDGPSAYL